MGSYIPPALTIERGTDPDRFRLSDDYGVRDNVRWHDAVLSVEIMFPSMRRTAGAYVHPAIVDMLNDVRHCDATGVAALTLHGEPR